MIERIVWLGALVLVVAGAVRAREAAAPPYPQPAAIPAVPPGTGPEANAARLDSLAETLLRADPFRLAAGVHHTDQIAEADAAAAARAPRVTGILGPPWQAILADVPGRGAVVARPGERFGDLLILAVGPDSVVVEGVDTTWVLLLERR